MKNTPDSATTDLLKRVFVVALGTKTPEKVIHYNTIARLLDIPITFIPFDQIALFHSADEDLGDRVAHAHDKLAELSGPIESIKQSKRYEEAIRRVCAEYGVVYDPQTTYFASEDSSLGIPLSRWEATKSIYDDYLPQNIIDNASKDQAIHDDIDDIFQGPGSEIGPILGAMRMSGFFRAATHGTTADEKVLTLDSSTMVVRRLDSDTTEPVKEITGKQVNLINTTLQDSADLWLDLSFQNLSLPQTPNKLIADDLEDYLSNHSPRTKIMRELYDYMLAQPYDIRQAEKAAARVTTLSPRTFNIRVLSNRLPECTQQTFGKSLHGKREGIPNLKRGKFSKSTDLKPSLYWDALDLSRNFEEGNDAILIGPEPGNIPGGKCGKSLKRSLQSLCNSGYVLFSADVEKQLEPRNANTPIIIMNDGSHDQNLEIRRYLVNSGMTKDIDFLPVYEKNGSPVLPASYKNMTGIEHKALGMLDVISYTDPANPYPQRLANAAKHILYHRMKNNRRYQGLRFKSKHKITNKSAPYRLDIMKVSVLTSAGNDNITLLLDNAAIGHSIAKNNAGLVWGAGDRHGMGAVYDGYKDAKGPWIEGYSTRPILVSETKHGWMPQCDYSEISPDIYHRMAKIIEASDVIAMTPGGIGTIQEMLAVFKLMYEKPELMENKSFIFHNPILWDNAPFMNAIIETYLGKSALLELHKTGKLTGQNMDIRMTSTTEEFDAVIGEKKREWDYRQTQAALPVVKVPPQSRRRLAA